MSKNKEYFQHDTDSIGDLKLVAAIEEYGPAGYGIFWRIVEILHEREGHKIEFKKYIFLAIAKQMNSSAEQIEKFVNSCVNDYDLFKCDGHFFWSERVLNNIERRNEISVKRSESGRLGASIKQAKANAKQSEANKNSKEKGNTSVLPKKKNSINVGFEVFWDLYGNKIDRAKSEKKWASLTDEERTAAIADIPGYIAGLRDRQYQKNPLTYLNGKCWLDERGEPLPTPIKVLNGHNPNSPDHGKFVA